MNKFPHKILLTIPKQKVKSDVSKIIMSLRPSAYRIFELTNIQYEWEYKSEFLRDRNLSNIIDVVQTLPTQEYNISIVD
jgi:hypothetical protein